MVVIVTLWTRLRRGPAHPRWSTSAELVLRVTRRLIATFHDDLSLVKRLTRFGRLSPWMSERVDVETGTLAGMPVEELLFAIAFGAYWSSIYEHFTWKVLTASPARHAD